LHIVGYNPGAARVVADNVLEGFRGVGDKISPNSSNSMGLGILDMENHQRSQITLYKIKIKLSPQCLFQDW